MPWNHSRPYGCSSSPHDILASIWFSLPATVILPPIPGPLIRKPFERGARNGPRPAYGTVLKERRREAATRAGDRVRFRASSIFLSPTPEPISPDEELEGTVVAFSDSGNQPSVFAVIEVVRNQTLVVPVSELQECH